MATWTLLSATAVGDGARVVLTWKVEGTTTEIGADPDWQPDSGCTQTGPTTTGIYTFDNSNRKLAGASAPLYPGDLSEWKRVVTGSNVELTFSMRIPLTNTTDVITPTEVAINTQEHSPTITVPANTVTLKFSDASDLTGPPAAAVSGFSLDCTGVGILPGGSNLKLFADAHAESVAQSLAAVNNLATWSNLAGGVDLTSPSGKQPKLFEGNGAVPKLDFNAANNDYMAMTTGVPSITETGTIAAVFIPSAVETGQHILGRWNSGGQSWRFRYDDTGETKKIVYENATSSGTTAYEYDLDEDDSTVLFVFRRKPGSGEGTVIHEMWISGRLTTGTGTVPPNPEAGSGSLTIGSRDTGSGWGDSFDGQINQVAVYDSYVTDMQLSLILHSMAHRAGVDLGLPAVTTQPYPDSNKALSKPWLGRKPIAVFNLFVGESAMDENPYGQASDWRGATQAAIEKNLLEDIRRAINACDDFEIMFNRPGGSYADGVIPSDAFASAMNRGITGDEPMMRSIMIDAMASVWTTMRLGDESPEVGRGVPTSRDRRGWFYVGSGFAMEPDATLTPTGQMYNRNVAPATGQVYLDEMMDPWITEFAGVTIRCFMLDLAGSWRGQFISMCHSSAMQDAGFLFVGEAIANGDDDARLGAVWFGVLDYAKAPWWNIVDQEYNREQGGYNTQWEGDWATKPVYVRVSNGDYPYLYSPRAGEIDPGKGENMKLGDIYRFILKGATPVVNHRSVQRRVGAAWNYATGRLPQNIWDRMGRVVRFQR